MYEGIAFEVFDVIIKFEKEKYATSPLPSLIDCFATAWRGCKATTKGNDGTRRKQENK
jgi:hypothetical protein